MLGPAHLPDSRQLLPHLLGRQGLVIALFVFLQNPLEDGVPIVQLHGGLGDIVQAPQPQGGLDIGEVLEEGQHHELHLRLDLPALLHEFDPVHLRHVDIHEHQVHRVLPDELQGRLAVLHVPRHHHAVGLPVHQGHQAPPGQFVVIHYQNLDHVCSFAIRTGMMMVTLVPLPISLLIVRMDSPL